MSKVRGTYKHKPLSGDDIRIITLFAGEFGEDICLSLTHEALVPAEPNPQPKRLSKGDLQKTLPDDWKVFESPEGRYLFVRFPEENVQYEHPDADVDPELYAPPEDPDPDSGLEYEALSYVWGSLHDTDTVYIRSNLSTAMTPSCRHDSDTTLRIGQNLAHALRHLRYPERQRRLWIDQIAICQDELKERELQVQRMGLIYSLARRVVVWPGSESETTAKAFPIFRYFGQQMEISTDYWHFAAPDASEPDWQTKTCALPYEDDTWQSILDVLERPWFERVWVMQEIRLANHHAVLRLGGREISYYHFRRAMDLLYLRAGVPRRLASAVERAYVLASGQSGLTLSEVLTEARRRQCSDPRDRLYGTLSIVPPRFARRIRPQYSQPVEQTYAEAFIASVACTSRLDLLSKAFLDEDVPSTPSWAPDWSRPYRGLRQAFSNQVSGVSMAHFQSDGLKTIKALGVTCATIRVVSKQIPFDKREAVRSLAALEPVGLLTDTYPNGCSALEAYLRVLLLDYFGERYPAVSSYPEMAAWKETFLKHIASSAPSPDSDHVPDTMVEAIWTSTFVFTDQGYFGFGPSSAQTGRWAA